jgi:hypothetical protein
MLPWPPSSVGLDDQDHEVGAGGVGDERLGAVDDVLVTVEDRGGADSGDVGSGSRLGDAEGTDLRLRCPNQPALLPPLAEG